MAFLRDTSLFCIPDATFTNVERGVISGICMATSTIGFLGAALQLKSLWQFRNRQRRWPSADPRIIFYLALSDLFACLGVFILAVFFVAVPSTPGEYVDSNYIVIVNVSYNISSYQEFIVTIESMTLFSYLASFIWTFSYALDMCLQFFRIECPIVMYHVLAWLIPVDLVATIEAINLTIYRHSCELKRGQMSRLILSYFLIPLVILGNSLLFSLIYRKIKQRARAATSWTNVDRAALGKFKRKFFLMVLVFVICWIPNIYSVSFDITHMRRIRHHRQYSIPKDPRDLRHIFVYIEAFLNPLQGLFNYLIYKNSFKVTATDTRPRPRRNLPAHVSSRYGSLQRQLDASLRVARKPSQRTLTESASSCDQSTQFHRSSGSDYTYRTKLLGELK